MKCVKGAIHLITVLTGIINNTYFWGSNRVKLSKYSFEVYKSALVGLGAYNDPLVKEVGIPWFSNTK